jgi:central glycolytic genes regulator
MDYIKLIKSIAPEVTDIVEKRYLILRTIYFHQPVGRRTVSSELGLGERIIRNEVNILKEQGLINIEVMGMYVTKEGKNLIEDLHEVYKDLKGIIKLQERLKECLDVERVIIIPGNSHENELVLKEMGKTTSSILKQLIHPKDIIGITGGNTMAVVAEEMTEDDKPNDVLVIPARGGLGRELETQANSIAAKMGKKLGGSYRLLYVPDTLEKEALDIMIKNDEIKESIELINNISLLIFGIGRADTMAHRRNLPQDTIDNLMELGAVAEAFGHYFDINGKEIWEYKTIGLSLKKFKEMNHIIGVAGGEEKAEAIIAISSLRRDLTIVTDESAARKILELVQ